MFDAIPRKMRARSPRSGRRMASGDRPGPGAAPVCCFLDRDDLRQREFEPRMMSMTVAAERAVALRVRVAVQVATLDARAEHETLCWIEAVSEFDDPSGEGVDEAR
jgi:hypothetical protein